MKKSTYIQPATKVEHVVIETLLNESSWGYAVDGVEGDGVNGNPEGGVGGAKENKWGVVDWNDENDEASLW